MKRLNLVVLTALMFLVTAVTGWTAEVYIPHITYGADDWYDYLQVDNNSSDSADFTLVLYYGGSQTLSKSYTVEGMSKRVLNLKTLTDQAECGKVTYADDGLVFRLSYENNIGFGLAEFMLNDSLASAMGLYFSNYSSSVENKGLAITNMSASTANITLYAVGAAGILDTATFDLAGYSKIIGVHTSWFPNVAFADLDRVMAVTDSACLAGLTITSDNSCSKLLFAAGTDSPAFEGSVMDSSDDSSSSTDDGTDGYTAKLLGSWIFSYTIISTFTETYTLNEVTTVLSDEGYPLVVGEDQYGGVVGAQYTPDDTYSYCLLDYGYLFDKFYVFNISGNSISSGKYMQVIDGSIVSNLYDLSGTKTSSTYSDSGNKSIYSSDKAAQIEAEQVIIAEDRAVRSKNTTAMSSSEIDPSIMEMYWKMKNALK